MARNANAPAGTGARREEIDNYPNATAPRQPTATDCPCKACADLREECGEFFGLYSRKLLIVGWSGAKSPVEIAYCRTHRSQAQQAAALASGARLKVLRGGPKPLPAAVVSPEATSITSHKEDACHGAADRGVA